MMKTVVSNYITIYEPDGDLLEWCENNLTMHNPKYYSLKNLGFSTYGVPKTLQLFEYSRTNNVLRVPYGLLRYIYQKAKYGEVILDFAKDEDVSVDFGCNASDFGLYDYQAIAVEELKKKKMGVLRSKAGSGKTQMGIALITELGRKALWITHTKELLKQSKDRAARYIDESMLGTITEGKVNIGSGITFATVQTLANLNLSDLRKEWDCIIVDECHRVAGSPEQLMQFSYVLSSLAAKHKYGLSATLHRSDGMTKTIFAYIGPVAYDVPEEAVKDKIMDVDITPKQIHLQLPNSCFRRNGNANYVKVTDYIIKDINRNNQIVSDLIDSANHYNLILSTRLEHLEILMNSMPESLADKCVMIYGGTTTKAEKAAREAAIESVRSGEKKYLFATYQLAKEGLDIPRLDRLFLTVPQSDYSVIIQSVGRIARTFAGKEPPIAYDYVDDDPYLIKKFNRRCMHYDNYGYNVTNRSLTA